MTKKNIPTKYKGMRLPVDVIYNVQAYADKNLRGNFTLAVSLLLEDKLKEIDEWIIE